MPQYFYELVSLFAWEIFSSDFSRTFPHVLASFVMLELNACEIIMPSITSMKKTNGGIFIVKLTVKADNQQVNYIINKYIIKCCIHVSSKIRY